MEEKHINRRAFLKASAMTTVAMVAAACAQPTPEVIEKEVPVEKVVKETVVVEKEVPVEKVVKETVVVEKEVAVEKVVTATPIPATFSEPPMLADMVAAGDLPPVEERLPSQPYVMDVVDRIGTYGGTIRRGFIAPSDVGSGVGRFNGLAMNRWDVDGLGITPFICSSWENQQGGQVWIFNLREGIKWSDGEPLTADDFVYQYEDVYLNEELGAGWPAWFRGPVADPAVVEKVDDYTIKITYAQPFYPLPEMFATTFPASPAHYMKQFHADYSENVQKVAEDADFEDWTQYYWNRNNWQYNIDLPRLNAWLMQNNRGETLIRITRNPYYPVVDPEGNQLPYIDELRYDLVANPDVLVIRAIEGSIDFQARHMQTTAIPVLKENEAQGNYYVNLVPGFGGNDAMFNINISYQGPENVVLSNRDFRLALSAAIDRDFIHEVSFVGLGTPSNYLPAPTSPQHPGPEWERKYAEYDVDLANELLDGVIPDRDDEGMRTLPDGSRLEIVISCTPAFGPWPDIAEQVSQMWGAVGVRTQVDIMERSLLGNRRDANECMVYMWGPGRAVNMFVQSPWIDCSQSCPWGQAYQTWYASDGAEGIEPPDGVKHLTELVVEGRGLPPEEANPLAQEVYKWIIENQVIIGTVRRSPMVMGVTVVSNRLGNIPESWANDTMFNTPWPARPDQFFYVE